MNRWGMRRREGLDADGRGAESRLPVAAVAVRVGLAGWLGREGEQFVPAAAGFRSKSGISSRPAG